MPGPDIRVDLYTRVSTDMQAEEGYSLAEQESRLRLYAESQVWKVHAIHRDGGYSGKDLNRPGIQYRVIINKNYSFRAKYFRKKSN